MTQTNESSTVPRLSRAGADGNSDGMATSSQPLVRESGVDHLRSRPIFEDACLAVLDDFRRGRVNRTAVTTQITVAIASACLPDSEEVETFERYFSCRTLSMSLK